jgi:glyoxylase-like metal-dependent hydrolase (beta-lactamase superfamily II)
VATSRSAWIEPGIYEVAPGVHRIPLPLPNDGLRAVNIYVVEAPDGPVLIDSGWALDEAREQLEAGLRERQFGLADVSRFLVTHIHRDHYTQAIAIRRDFGTKVSLGENEAPALEATMAPGRLFPQRRDNQLVVWGAEHLVDEVRRLTANIPMTGQENWALPDDWLRDGQQIPVGARTLDVVATPGHTVGHVVFVDAANNLLFAGDHVLPQITPSISLEAVNPLNPLGDFLESLALVRSMPDRMLLPAHGPVTDSVHARIDELIDHHGRRLDECEKSVLAGASTGYDVARTLRWTRHEFPLDDLDIFNRIMATGETGAHLILLVAQGRLKMTDIDGVRHFSAP